MADTVQYLLEQMVPELEDYEKRGLFNRSELKQIVKKRTDFEYKLKRRAALKPDFAQYVEYETKLENLRQLRKSSLVRKLRSANLRWRPSLCDRAIPRRIMFIYERAVRKFKGDLRLWLKYMEFCRNNGGTRQMQKVVSKALQLHPTVPGLWMYAASWEFGNNLNHAAARALMLQGLRMNPKSESLWLEYMRMELTFSAKLKARQLLLLGEEPIVAVHEEEEESLDVGGKESSKGGVRKLEQLSASMAKTVYENAIAAVPDNVGFRIAFLDLLMNASGFLGKEKLEKAVIDSLARDFPGNARCIDCTARWVRNAGRAGARNETDASSGSGIEAAEKVYKDGLEIHESLELYNLYSLYLEEELESAKQQLTTIDNGLKHSKIEEQLVNQLCERLLELYTKAKNSNFYSQTMGERHLALLLQGGHIDRAKGEVSDLCTGRFSTCPSFWELRLRLCTEEVGKKNGAEVITNARDEMLELIKEGLKSVQLKDSLPLWEMLMEQYAFQKKGVDTVLSLATLALGGEGRSEGASALACSVVTWVLHLKGLEAARQASDKFLSLPGPSIALMRLSANLEFRAYVSGDEDALSRMRKSMLLGVDVDGTSNPDVWLDFCRLEIEAGKPEEASALYWRAKKMLNDPSIFLERYQELLK